MFPVRVQETISRVNEELLLRLKPSDRKRQRIDFATPSPCRVCCNIIPSKLLTYRGYITVIGKHVHALEL